MIGIVDCEIQAANPSMPLFPMRAFKGSPSSIRVRNVPKKIGSWQINKVYFNAAYPDNSIASANCVLVGGVWVGTIAGSSSSGYSENGYTVYADGIDENGNEVTGYVLGKGDITILESDGAITPGSYSYYVHLLSAQPDSPKDGDMWQVDGNWFMQQNGQAWPIGDDSGLFDNLSAQVQQISSGLSAKADKTKEIPVTETLTVPAEIKGFSTNAPEGFDGQNAWTAYADRNYFGSGVLRLELNHQLIASDSERRVWWSGEAQYDYEDEGEIRSFWYWAAAVYDPQNQTFRGLTFPRRDSQMPQTASELLAAQGTGEYDNEHEFTSVFGLSWPESFATLDTSEPDALDWNYGMFEGIRMGAAVEVELPSTETVKVLYENDLSAAILLQDEYKTKVTFNTDDANKYITQIFDWQGEVNSSMLSGLELSAIEGIKFGKGVSAIADGALSAAGSNLRELYFSDQLRRIGISAFAGNMLLCKVVYGNDTPQFKLDGNYAFNKNEGGELSIGDGAFQGCTFLGQVILPDIDKLTVGENAFAGCNFKYDSVINGQMIHTAGLFFRNFYNETDLGTRLSFHNLSAEYAAGICHAYIPATTYDIEKAGQENDSKYLGTYADANFSVTPRGANLALSAFAVNNVHISADPGSNRTKNITFPARLTADHSPRSLTVDLSVDAGVTFAGTVNKLTALDWYLDGTIEQFRSDFLSAGVEVLWKFWEYKPNVWCAKKLGVR